MIEILKKAAAHQTQISGSGGPATLEWNPQELGTSVVRALYNPVGDNSSVTESAGNITAISDLSGNGFDITATNNPNWNSATSTVEIDHTANEQMLATIDSPPSTNVGHLFVYAELGPTDSFGRYIGVSGENDTNQSDYATPFVRDGSNRLTIYGGGAEILNGGTVPTGFNLLEARMESGNTTYFINGTELATIATGSNLNFENLSIGRGWSNTYGASINWRCACLVEGNLSEDDRQRIEGWMMQQCSDQGSLPGSHPYKNTAFSDPLNGFTEVAISTAVQHPTGSTYEGGDNYIWRGAGGDLWGNNDQVVFIHKELGDNVTVDLYISAVDLISGDQAGIEQYAGVYLMARQTLANNAVHYSIGTNPNNIRVQQKYRATENQSTAESNAAENPSVPVWLRLERSGGVLTQSYSMDGTTYTQLGQTPTIGSDNWFIGVAISSHDDSAPDFISATGTLTIT